MEVIMNLPSNKTPQDIAEEADMKRKNDHDEWLPKIVSLIQYFLVVDEMQHVRDDEEIDRLFQVCEKLFQKDYTCKTLKNETCKSYPKEIIVQLASLNSSDPRRSQTDNVETSLDPEEISPDPEETRIKNMKMLYDSTL
jgi:hypothetical protein